MLRQRSNEFNGRGVNLVVISIVFTTVAVGLVGTRVASRLTTGRKLGSDDYAIILSMVGLLLTRHKAQACSPNGSSSANVTGQVFSIGLTICNCISTFSSVHEAAAKHTPPVD